MNTAKLGIRKIEMADAKNATADWSYLPKNSSLKIEKILSNASFTELKFTQDTVSYNENWEDNENSEKSVIDISGMIRKNLIIQKSTLFKKTQKNKIFKIHAIDGRILLIGSPLMPAKIVFSEIFDSITTKNLSFTITNESTHGAINVIL